MITGILLTIAVLILIVIAALLIILWAVPVTFSGRGELRRDAQTLICTVCAQWGPLSLQTHIPEEDTASVILFGRTVRQVPIAGTRTETGTEVQKEKAEPEKQTGKKTGKQTGKQKPLPDIIGIADAVLTHIGALLRQIAIDHLRVSVRFGLGDAALTGEVFGLLMAIRGMLMATGGNVSLAAAAEFHERIVEGDAEGAIRIAHPLALVPPVIRIIRHPAVWKMVRER